MAVELRAAGDFVAEVHGIDARQPLSAEEVTRIEDGMAQFAVLVLRNQFLDDAQQVSFTHHFGPLLEGANTTKTDAMRLDTAFADVSNVDAQNNVLARDDRRRMFSLGNRLWHTDASFLSLIHI